MDNTITSGILDNFTTCETQDGVTGWTHQTRKQKKTKMHCVCWFKQCTLIQELANIEKYKGQIE